MYNINFMVGESQITLQAENRRDAKIINNAIIKAGYTPKVELNTTVDLTTIKKYLTKQKKIEYYNPNNLNT